MYIIRSHKTLLVFIILTFTIAASWIRSYTRIAYIEYQTGVSGGPWWKFRSVYGRLELWWGVDPQPTFRFRYLRWELGDWVHPDYDAQISGAAVSGLWGFVFVQSKAGHVPPFWWLNPQNKPIPTVWMAVKAVEVPYWSLVTIMALPLLSFVFRDMRRKWRSGRGQCPDCGYDVRTNTGRCPECGTAIRRRSLSAASNDSLPEGTKDSGK